LRSCEKDEYILHHNLMMSNGKEKSYKVVNDSYKYHNYKQYQKLLLQLMDGISYLKTNLKTILLEYAKSQVSTRDSR